MTIMKEKMPLSSTTPVPALRKMGVEGGPPLSYQEFELPHLLRG